MPRLARIAVIALTAAFFSPALRTAGARDFVFHHENVMGTSLELRVRADGADAARWAEQRVLGEIDRLSLIFSRYDPASEFRRWQDHPHEPAKISRELYQVLEACDRWRARSGGAFDPRVQALSQLWKNCAADDRTPTAPELQEAKLLMSRPAWRLDPGSGTAEKLSNCPLTLDAIAKGDIVERACHAALVPERGVRGLLLNVGGDLRVCGDMERTIGIVAPWADSETSEPLCFLELNDRAVATSGSYRRGVQIQGRWYSHIFDPRTGLPAGHVSSATVIAEHSADADALATICNVLEPGDSLRLVGSLPGVECLIVTSNGETVRSPGWARHERAQPALLAAVPEDRETRRAQDKKNEAPAGGSWGDSFELLIQFTINQPPAERGRYRRPYVAVWVEDREGKPIRDLLLWLSFGGAGPYQWVPEMKRWYRKEDVRRKFDKTDLYSTLAGPTRPPGKYSVIWDGKDYQGKPVPPGEYTIYIDAAREHGTYQSIRKTVAIGTTPFAEDLKGNVEIKSARLEYRRKTAPK